MFSNGKLRRIIEFVSEFYRATDTKAAAELPVPRKAAEAYCLAAALLNRKFAEKAEAKEDRSADALIFT